MHATVAFVYNRASTCSKNIQLKWILLQTGGSYSKMSEQIIATKTDLPLSRPTPQTRMLAIGWEWSTLRSMGSTRFNILFSSTRYMSFPCAHTQKPHRNPSELITETRYPHFAQHSVKGHVKKKVRHLFFHNRKVCLLPSAFMVRVCVHPWASSGSKYMIN